MINQDITQKNKASDHQAKEKEKEDERQRKERERQRKEEEKREKDLKKAIKKQKQKEKEMREKKDEEDEAASQRKGERRRSSIENEASDKGGVTSFGFARFRSRHDSDKNHDHHRDDGGADADASSNGYSGPSVFGLLKALAKGSDEPLHEDDDDDEDASSSSSSDDDGQRTNRSSASTRSGATGGPHSSSMENVRPLEPIKEGEPITSPPGETPPATTRPQRPGGGVHREPSYGEWIPAVHIPTSNLGGTSEKEQTTAMPAFYRQPSVEQDDLTHRLAVLSVNNFSGLSSAVGNVDEIKLPRRRTASAAGRTRAPTRESLRQRSATSADVRRKKRSDGGDGDDDEFDIDEDLKRREQKIRKTLKQGSAEELTAMLVPPDLRRKATDENVHHDDAEDSRDDHDEATQVGDHEDDDEDPKYAPKISNEEKLAAIKEEFGDWTHIMRDREPEQFVGECRGALFRGILILGNIHLTTYRVTFHAMLPPPVSDDLEDGNAAIVHSGPVTIQRKGVVLGPRTHRVWMELSADMLTTYPSADEEGRVKPLRSILLGSIKQLYPLDPEKPFEIRLRYQVPNGEVLMVFTVDTQESALHWHRDLESSLFQHGRTRRYQKRLAERRKNIEARPDAPSMSGEPIIQEDDGGWELLRICLPLDRVKEVGTEDYMEFARLISLDVDVMCDSRGVPLKAVWSEEHDLLLPENHWPGRQIPNGGSTGTSTPSTPVVGGGEVRKTSSLRECFTRSVSGRSTPTSPIADAPKDSDKSKFQSKDFAKKSNGNLKDKTGDGAFRGPTEDPENLTSNASIIPQKSGTGPTDEHPERHTKINVKFGILNEREEFAKKFHEVVQAASQQGPQFIKGIDRPGPVLELGNCSLLQMREVEGGAGLKAGDIESDARHRKLRFKIGNKNDHEHNSEDSDSSSDEDDADDASVDPQGLTGLRKREKAAEAKAVFGIPERDIVWMKRCYLQKTVPFRGHIILGEKYICFWRKVVGPVHDIKYRFPVHDLKGAEIQTNNFRVRFHGMAVQISGHPDLHFEFFSKGARDATLARVNELVEDHKKLHKDEDKSGQDMVRAAAANTIEFDETTPAADRSARTDKRQQTMGVLTTTQDEPFSLAIPDEAISHLPNIINDRSGAKKVRARRFALLTIGSRGDIQPYIALALGLMNDGHKVSIVTHDEFKEWVEGYGIEHRQAGGDPAALMKLSVEHKMFSPGFFKESLGHFRQWLDDLLKDSWHACKDADVLIESPSAMAGIHIAEALEIPYFRAFTMPWTRTSAYPQAFMVPAVEMGPGFNYSTYVLFDNIMWKATSGQINRWRKKHLKLAPTDMSKLSQTKVPFMYNFSSAICPKPLDWHDDIAITGYWYLENSDSDWSPPEDLERFLEKAKRDERPIVYIGFGSIVVPHPNEMTRSIIKAVDKANVRAIIAKGWSSRGGDDDDDGSDPIAFSDNCYSLDKVPHGWLFPRIDAALHHGGAGTVGASLRAGIPTLIKPWFGDQMFWAARVTKLGVGVRVNDLDSDSLAKALDQATRDRVMRERASKIGEKIRSEDGVGNAIDVSPKRSTMEKIIR